MQIVLRGENKMHDGREIKCEAGTKGLREKIYGTRAKEEIQKLGWKRQGADSVVGDSKTREGAKKM